MLTEAEHRQIGLAERETYSEYLARQKESAREHYAKYESLAKCFSIEQLKALVPATPAEIRKALDNGDKHLNTIPRVKWDYQHWYFKKIPRAAYDLTRGNWALCETVCLLKHVARHHIAGEPSP